MATLDDNSDNSVSSETPAVAGPKPTKKRRKKRTKAAKGAITPIKRSRGRPTLWEPSFLERAYHYALLGSTDEKIAQFLGVSVPCLDRWKREREDLRQVLV